MSQPSPAPSPTMQLPWDHAGHRQEAEKCYGYGKCLHNEYKIGEKAGYCN